MSDQVYQGDIGENLTVSRSQNATVLLVNELSEHGNNYEVEGKLDEALACYQQILEVAPNWEVSYQKLGNIYFKKEEFELSIEAYQKSLEINPNLFWSYNNIGEGFLKLQKWEEAIPFYQRALELNPDFFWTNYSLAEALVQLQRWEEAVPLYQKSIEIDPDFVWSYTKLGEILIKLRRWEEVVPIYRRALELNPNFVWGYSKLGEALIQLKKWEEAIESYDKFNQLNPNFFWSYNNLGDASVQLQRWENALVAYQRAVEIDPKSYLCYHKLGEVYLQLKQQEEAIASFKKALEIQPNFELSQRKLNQVSLEVHPPVPASSQVSGMNLEPIDWLNYSPKSGQEKCYVIAKKTRPQRHPETDKWEFAVPPQELMISFSDNEEYYLHTGKAQVLVMLKTLQEAHQPLKPGMRILDFGCASGRLIRELADYAEDCEIWGTDINADCISWCQQNLTPPFHFFVGTSHPHIPFEDHYFDLIYAGSVFTHIDDLADAWLLELRRLLKPGGLAYITIQDQTLINIIKPFQEQWLSNQMLASQEQKQEYLQKYQEYINTDFAMFTLGRNTRSLVFYDFDEFCDRLKPFFEITAVKKEAYYWQTAVLLRKK